MPLWRNDPLQKVQKKLTAVQTMVSKAITSANSIFQAAIDKVKAAKATLTGIIEDLLAEKPLLEAEKIKLDEKIAELEATKKTIDGNFTEIDAKVEEIKAKRDELDNLVKKLEEFTVKL